MHSSLQTMGPSGGADTSDGMGGLATVMCLTPSSQPAAEVGLGLKVTRGGQNYSTHNDAASSSRPFGFFTALPSDAAYAPEAGPSSGGTLLNVSLPALGSKEIAKCTSA